MPRSNKKKSTGSTPKGVFDKFTFINYSLGKAEKQACKAWCDVQSFDMFQVLAELVDGGYKVSMSYDFENSVAFVSLTNKSGPESFQNKVLSMRARTVDEAFMRIIWLHAVQADGDWNNLTEEMDEDIW